MRQTPGSGESSGRCGLPVGGWSPARPVATSAGQEGPGDQSPRVSDASARRPVWVVGPALGSQGPTSSTEMDGGGTVLSLEAPLPHGEVTGLISCTVCPLASGFETPEAAPAAVPCPGAVVASATDTAQLTIITSLSGVRL